MNEFKITGGARIGMANATWPFATLTAGRNKIELNATILGKLVFLPGDIIALTPNRGFRGPGVKITHNVANYKSDVIFWTKNPQQVISDIQATGFMDAATRPLGYEYAEVKQLQAMGGFPIKKSAAILIGVLWNVFFIIGFIAMFLQGNTYLFNIASSAALLMVLGVCLLTLVSPAFAGLILKEGREVRDIKKFIFFLMAIALFMLINFAAFSGMPVQPVK